MALSGARRFSGPHSPWVCVSESHHRFDPAKSSTFQNLNKPLSIQYGTGSMQGFLGLDTVTVSGAWGQPGLTFPSPPAALPPGRPGSGGLHLQLGQRGPLGPAPAPRGGLVGRDSRGILASRGCGSSLPLLLPRSAPRVPLRGFSVPSSHLLHPFSSVLATAGSEFQACASTELPRVACGTSL